MRTQILRRGTVSACALVLGAALLIPSFVLRTRPLAMDILPPLIVFILHCLGGGICAEMESPSGSCSAHFVSQQVLAVWGIDHSGRYVEIPYTLYATAWIVYGITTLVSIFFVVEEIVLFIKKRNRQEDTTLSQYFSCISCDVLRICRRKDPEDNAFSTPSMTVPYREDLANMTIPHREDLANIDH